jgi:hypothetical protein
VKRNTPNGASVSERNSKLGKGRRMPSGKSVSRGEELAGFPASDNAVYQAPSLNLKALVMLLATSWGVAAEKLVASDCAPA